MLSPDELSLLLSSVAKEQGCACVSVNTVLFYNAAISCGDKARL